MDTSFDLDLERIAHHRGPTTWWHSRGRSLACRSRIQCCEMSKIMTCTSHGCKFSAFQVRTSWFDSAARTCREGFARRGCLWSCCPWRRWRFETCCPLGRCLQPLPTAHKDTHVQNTCQNQKLNVYGSSINPAKLSGLSILWPAACVSLFERRQTLTWGSSHRAIILPTSWIRPTSWNQSVLRQFLTCEAWECSDSATCRCYLPLSGCTWRMPSAVWKAWKEFGKSTSGSDSSTSWSRDMTASIIPIWVCVQPVHSACCGRARTDLLPLHWGVHSTGSPWKVYLSGRKKER